MKQEVMKVISKAGVTLKKHSPEILAGAGIIGSVAAIILACKATTKAPKVIEDTKKELEEIHEKEITEDYTEKDRGKEVAKVYLHTSMEFVKLYGLAFALEVASMGSFLKAIGVLKKDNVQMAGTIATLTEGARRYRQNVIERFGEDVDYELEHGIRKQEIQTEETDPETGKTKKVKKQIEVADPNRTGAWTKYFTRTNPYWDENSDNGRMNDDYLEMFFKMRLSELNTRLIAKRNSLKDPFVTVNDAFEAYGFERESGAYTPSWKYDQDNGISQVDINWHKVFVKDEDGKFEEVYAIDFYPTHNSKNGELLNKR